MLIPSEPDPTPIPGYKMALAGTMAGGIAGFLGNPAELIMVRMQADKAKPVESESRVPVRVWVLAQASARTPRGA